MASSRTVVLAATGVLAVVAAGVVGASAGSDHAERDAAPSVATSSAPAPTRGPAASTSSPSASPTRTPAGGSGSASTGPGQGSEILPTPADPTSTATGYHLPPLLTSKPSPLLGSTLPTSAVAKGRLVAGFPTALAPPKGTSVESSSISVARRVVQAALVTTGGDPQAVLVHYRELLTSRGFHEEQTQAVENAPAAAFTSGRDNVTITVHDGKSYLLANLRASGASD